MQLQNRGKQEKISKKVEAISEKVKDTQMKASDLVIPISIGVVLVLLTLFVFVPMITAALDYQSEMQVIKQKVNTLKTLETTIDNIDQNQITDDIIIAKTVVPKILKVSDFLYYVDSLAITKGLKEKELSAGDQIVSGDKQNSNSSVSGPVEYQGSFEKVLSFLEEVQSSSPYLINIKNVELSRPGSTNDWSVSLTVGGYYMSDKPTDNIDLYAPFKVYTTYENVMEVFRAKSASID